MSFALFNNFSQIGFAQAQDQLQGNMVYLLDYAFLCAGGFNNVSRNVVSPYGGYQARLRLCDDSRYTKGTVWESARSNWVWESNIEYDVQPISVSGIYVNNSFLPYGSGYYINYPAGQVVFNSPIAFNSRVEVEYSYKFCNIYSASLQWFRQIQNESFRVDSPQFNSYGSGSWSLFSDSRAQLPAVFPYISSRRKFIPKQLGGGSWCIQDVAFYIMAETTSDRDNIMDALSYQKEKRIFFFDKNKVAAARAYPLDFNGIPQSGALTYPNLVENYLWSDAVVQDTAFIDKNDEDAPNLFRGTVSWTLKIDFPSL